MNNLTTRLSLYFIMLTTAAVVAAAALVFAMMFVHQALEPILPAGAVAGLICIGAFVSAGALFAGGIAILRPAARRPQLHVDEDKLAAALREAFGTDMVALLQSRPRATVTIALLAGVATGMSPELRRLLRGLL